MFQVTPQNVTLHLKAIFAEGKIEEAATCKEYLQVRPEGIREVSRRLRHYSLPAVLAVGYLVRSHHGTQFRQWATHGHTAAEIVHGRADAGKPRMGLTVTRAGGVIRKGDVAIAKNYLAPDELEALNRIVSAHLEFAELQALNRKPMKMRDWIAKLDDFLRLSGRELLGHAGKISAEQARAKAETEYEKYRKAIDAQPRPVDAVFEAAAKKLAELKKQSPSKRRTALKKAPANERSGNSGRRQAARRIILLPRSARPRPLP
ncbi:RhuM family protein [Methylocystis heyeri]|uniref:RhuM family protein n=1 Tax=Methylocystis heyeri TaxID=391905 RepID=UPI00113A1AD8|nr:RhuM family protein [Methylocystis heyeri]